MNKASFTNLGAVWCRGAMSTHRSPMHRSPAREESRSDNNRNAPDIVCPSNLQASRVTDAWVWIKDFSLIFMV